MSEAASHDVTRLLAAIGAGDAHAERRLLPLVYDELRRLAHQRMAREPPGQTLQPTALVHEAYLRLVGDEPVRWENRAHFFGAAARAMRRILVERARKRAAPKHGGGLKRIPVDDLAIQDPEQLDLLALDEALTRFEASDKRAHDVVLLRFFAGLGIEETATALGISPATVKREWAYAKAWLHHELTSAGQRPERGADVE